MDVGTAKRIEVGAAAVASSALAGAIGFAVYAGLAAVQPWPRAVAVVTAVLAGLLLGWRVLAQIGPAKPDFAVQMFDLGAVPGRAPPETAERGDEPLELVDLNRAPLELVDVLEPAGSSARVVQLFNPDAMPTPGELKARIDRHLGRECTPAIPADASQALFDALTQLRHSLR
ncbi:MAG: hypothetical protein ABIW33_07545 [Sphingomicrobium sp.]